MLRHFLQQIKWNRHAGAKWTHLIHFSKWKNTIVNGRSTIQLRLPWLTYPAIQLLERTVKPTDKVFEFGGGGSTLFWADRVAEIVTVEHDAPWFGELETNMASSGEKRKWKGHHVPATKGSLVQVPDPAVPEHFASADENSVGHHFKEYVSVIDQYPDGNFDVVLVDGRARASCLQHSIPKLRSGGLLILDNAERDYYTRNNTAVLAQCDVILSGMAPALLNRDFSETRIYRKR